MKFPFTFQFHRLQSLFSSDSARLFFVVSSLGCWLGVLFWGLLPPFFELHLFFWTFFDFLEIKYIEFEGISIFLLRVNMVVGPKFLFFCLLLHFLEVSAFGLGFYSLRSGNIFSVCYSFRLFAYPYFWTCVFFVNHTSIKFKQPQFLFIPLNLWN